MKSHIPHAIAAVLAASAVSLAMAQSDQGSNTVFVPEPIASASKSDGPDAGLAGDIVQALNADASLKNSKITVQADENGIVTLTGATMTQDQAQRAFNIAAVQAGDTKVVNTIQSDRIAYRTWAEISG